MQYVEGCGNWKGQRTFSALLAQVPRNPTLLISEIWAICVLARLVEAGVAKSEPEDASVVRFVGVGLVPDHIYPGQANSGDHNEAPLQNSTNPASMLPHQRSEKPDTHPP